MPGFMPASRSTAAGLFGLVALQVLSAAARVLDRGVVNVRGIRVWAPECRGERERGASQGTVNLVSINIPQSRGLDDGHLYSVAPRPFRRVYRGIGLRYEVLPPDAERIARRHSDAARQSDRRPEAIDAYLGNPVPDALRDWMRGRDIRAAEDDDKLLTPVAPDDIGMAQLRLDGRDDPAQARIPAACPNESLISLK